MHKEIVYDRHSRDWAMYLDGELRGYARNYGEAEVTLDRLVLDLLAQEAASQPGGSGGGDGAIHPGRILAAQKRDEAGAYDDMLPDSGSLTTAIHLDGQTSYRTHATIADRDEYLRAALGSAWIVEDVVYARPAEPEPEVAEVKPFFVRVPAAEYEGGCWLSALNAPFAAVVGALGEPHRTTDTDYPDDDYKTDVCWSVRSTDDPAHFVTIWNYKNGPNYNGGEGCVEDINSFSVYYTDGGFWARMHAVIVPPVEVHARPADVAEPVYVAPPAGPDHGVRPDPAATFAASPIADQAVAASLEGLAEREATAARQARERGRCPGLTEAQVDEIRAEATFFQRSANAYTKALIYWLAGIRPELTPGGAGYILPSQRAHEPPHMLHLNGDWTCTCPAGATMHWAKAMVIGLEAAQDALRAGAVGDDDGSLLTVDDAEIPPPEDEEPPECCNQPMVLDGLIWFCSKCKQWIFA